MDERDKSRSRIIRDKIFDDLFSSYDEALSQLSEPERILLFAYDQEVARRIEESPDRDNLEFDWSSVQAEVATEFPGVDGVISKHLDLMDQLDRLKNSGRHNPNG